MLHSIQVFMSTFHYINDILILTIMEYEWSNDVVNKILGIISLNLAGHKYLWIDVSHTEVEKTTHCNLCHNYERYMCHLGTKRHQSSQIYSTHILLVNGIQIMEPNFLAWLGASPVEKKMRSASCDSIRHRFVLYSFLVQYEKSKELDTNELASTRAPTLLTKSFWCWIFLFSHSKPSDANIVNFVYM